MTSDDDLKRLAMAIAPFMVEANSHGHSMVTIKLDLAKVLGVRAQKPGAGEAVIAIAAGPSKGVLEQAILLAQLPN